MGVNRIGQEKRGVTEALGLASVDEFPEHMSPLSYMGNAGNL